MKDLQDSQRSLDDIIEAESAVLPNTAHLTDPLHRREGLEALLKNKIKIRSPRHSNDTDI